MMTKIINKNLVQWTGRTLGTKMFLFVIKQNYCFLGLKLYNP